MDVPVLAGMAAAIVFAVSNLPMLWKAVRTRDVTSYSLSSIAMINAANVVYSLYVFSLPPGPVWLLHTFYLIASAVMLVLCLRHRGMRDAGGARRPQPRSSRPTDAFHPAARGLLVAAGGSLRRTVRRR